MSSGKQRWRWSSFQPTQVLPEILDALGNAVVAAGHNIEKGSQKLRATVPDVAELIPLAKRVKRAGEGLLQAPGQVGAVVGNVGEHLSELGHEGMKVLERVASLDLPGALRGARDLVGKGVGTLVDYGTSVGGMVVEKVDFNKQIDQLARGDRYTISVGGDISKEPDRFLGAKGWIDGCIEILYQPGGTYLVSVDGRLAAHIQPGVGGGRGVLAKGDLEALIGAGVKLEMTFDTKEQAKRATRSLLQMSLLAGASVAKGVGTGMLGGVMALPLGSMLAPSEADVEAMRDKISAMELRGHVAGQLAGQLGLGIASVDLAGVFGEVDAGTEVAIRLEFLPMQRPVVKLRQSILLGGGSNARAGIRLTQEARSNHPMADREFSVPSNSMGPGGIDLSAGIGAAWHGQISVEIGLRLPESVATADLIQSPIHTVRAVVQETLEQIPGRLSATVHLGGLVLSKKSGVEAVLQLDGDVIALLQSGAVRKLFQRKMQEAVTLAGQELFMKASVRPYVLRGHTLHPQIQVAGFGIGVQGGFTGVDYASPLWKYEGPLATLTTEAIEECERVLKSLQTKANSLTLGEQGDENDPVL